MKTKKLWKKILKIACITLASLIIVVITLHIVVINNTSIVFISNQKKYADALGTKTVNNYEPYSNTIDQEVYGNRWMKSNIKYGEDYPNSYFDITYKTKEKDKNLPTIVYVHGGGFLTGSKSLQKAEEAYKYYNMLYTMIDEGFNLVNVDYALTPDCLFPVPLIQLNQAFTYLSNNSEELSINMEKVILIGDSAGAVIVGQYCGIISNCEYATKMKITPAIDSSIIKTVVIDDGPFDYNKMNLGTKVMAGNYICNSLFPSDNQKDLFNVMNYLTSNYPNTFLVGTEAYGYDMETFHNILDDLNVKNHLEYYEKEKHIYITDISNNKHAQESYKIMMKFINNNL